MHNIIKSVSLILGITTVNYCVAMLITPYLIGTIKGLNYVF